MTAADHANTLRDALDDYHGYVASDPTEPDKAAYAALDALVAQAAELLKQTEWQAEELDAVEERRDQLQPERDRLADALQKLTLAATVYQRSPSGFGASAQLEDALAIARAALARTENTPDPIDGLTDDERNHRRDNALNYGEIERLRAERDRPPWGPDHPSYDEMGQ